jgi:cell division protein FtsI (penicillin-binding protein 3)/stage V sporulation protein D (sporulation-specific penicillin-binding protein)
MYPAKSLAPQLLGFVDPDNKGVAGLEKQYDALLTGSPGNEQVVRNPLGQRLQTLSEKAPINGANLILTIDADIQFEAESVLTQLVTEYSAEKASAIVLDPATGEVLAMANTPVFDTNAFAQTKPADQRNAAVSDQYEPGSTFKVVTAAAALSAGLVTPETTFRLAPTLKLYDMTVHEAEAVPAVRNLSVTQIIAQSSNVGAVTLGREVGKKSLTDMIYSFGFTHALGLDFPGEAGGSMPAPEKWSGTTIGNVPIGQGVAVTALQMAAAYGAIANGGVLMQPHLVKDGRSHVVRQVISPAVAAQLRSMLRVTVQSGTGTRAQVQGYDVAGKTGTAQAFNTNGGGYAKGKYVASFVGMVPADAPQLVILVVVNEPTSLHMGAEVAAPAFAAIAKFSLSHLGIAPKGQG